MSYHADKIEYTKKVSCELNRIMKERNVTVGELSERIGIPISIVDKFLNGEKLPDAYRMYRICRALNCSASEVMCVDMEV